MREERKGDDYKRERERERERESPSFHGKCPAISHDMVQLLHVCRYAQEVLT